MNLLKAVVHSEPVAEDLRYLAFSMFSQLRSPVENSQIQSLMDEEPGDWPKSTNCHIKKKFLLVSRKVPLKPMEGFGQKFCEHQLLQWLQLTKKGGCVLKDGF